MPTDGVKAQGKKVEQTINLKEMFGVSFEGHRSLRELVAGVMLERIRDRAAEGRGVDGRKLKTPYSKAYADTLDFKAFGKSRSNVNMRLTGDMLELMDVKKQTSDTITLGWLDATENAKAYNHQIGDTVPRRPFFGLNKKELKDIASDLKPQIREALKVKDEEGKKAFEDKVADLLNLFRESPEEEEPGIGVPPTLER